MLSQVFEYSKLFLQFSKWCNGLDDFKMTPFISPSYADIGIHPDHSYLETFV